MADAAAYVSTTKSVVGVNSGNKMALQEPPSPPPSPPMPPRFEPAVLPQKLAEPPARSLAIALHAAS